LADAVGSVAPASGAFSRGVLPLCIVLFGGAIACAAMLPLSGSVPVWALAAAAVGFLAIRFVTRAPGALDETLWPLVACACTLGVLEISRLDSALGSRQAVWIVVGLWIVIAGQRLFERYRRLESVAYVWVIASFALFILLQLFGTEVNGARLWFTFGSFEIQPVEIVKLFMVFFMASYLARNGAAIGSLAPSDVVANVRLLGPLLLGWGVSILVLALQRDVGEAILFLGVFVVMLYVASRRIDLVAISALVFGLGAWFVASHFAYVQARIAVWRDPWSDPLGAGYQAEQSFFALANGGLFGAGYHLGHPGFIPDAATDYILAALGEEFGVVGVIALLAIYLALVVRGMRIAFYAPDRFTALLATGFAATLGIQVFVIVAGVLGLLPLTGITLPFISYGGSSVVANIIMLDLLWLFSRRAGDAVPSAKVAPASLSG
jgi:cell division protein FtsW (lipid II flippase)